MMARFRLSTILLLWMGNCFLESCAEEMAEHSPWSAGTKFVFSIIPSWTGRLIMGTIAQGRVAYNLTCPTNCEGLFDIQLGIFQFPDFVNFEIPSDGDPQDLSGKDQRVFILMASAPVTAMLLILFDRPDSDKPRVAGTFLPPVSVAAEHYFYITRYLHGTLLITSLDYPATNVGIFPKDNVAFFMSFGSPGMQVIERQQFAPTFKYDKDLPESERISKVGEWNNFSLAAYESYYLKSPAADLTGMEIRTDKPVTILQGASEYGVSSSTPNYHAFLDTAPPVRSLGTHYFIPFIHPDDDSEIKIVSVSGSENVVTIESEQVETVTLKSTSDWFAFVGLQEPTYIVSKHPILVQRISLTNTDAPCLTTLPPVEAWKTVYRWSNFHFTNATNMHYFISVVLLGDYRLQTSSDEGLKFNDEAPEALWDVKLSSVDSGVVFSYTGFEVQEGSNEIYIEGSPGKMLFIEMFAAEDESRPSLSYCLIPEPSYPRLRQTSEDCAMTETVPGDMFDNDCDGRIDEEIENGEDDDQDGRVDEDIESHGVLAGQWGAWDVGECVKECGSTTGKAYFAARRCDNPKPNVNSHPCIGGDTMMYNEYMDCSAAYVKCESECLPKEWGYNCSLTCPKCLTKCNKKTGTCDRCPDGYASPFCNETCGERCLVCEMETKNCLACIGGFAGHDCVKSCDKNTYGVNCAKCSAFCRNGECHRITGHCLRCPDGKWGQDCKKNCLDGCAICSSRSGRCPPSYLPWYVFFITLFVVAFLLVCISFIKYRKRH